MFKNITSNLLNMVMQSSSQSCPKEMRNPLVMLLNTSADCALVESLLEIFKVAHKSVLMTLPLSNCTVRPDVVRTIYYQCGRDSG